MTQNSKGSNQTNCNIAGQGGRSDKCERMFELVTISEMDQCEDWVIRIMSKIPSMNKLKYS